jgi:hypothetical protein
MQKIIALAFVGLAITLTAVGADTDAVPPYSLIIKLDSRYNRGLILCTGVRPGEPFNVTWFAGNVKSVVKGVLQKREAEWYPLTLTVYQGLTDSATSNSQTEGYKLKLGVWKNSTEIISSAFNDIEKRDVLLVQGECTTGADAPSDRW